MLDLAPFIAAVTPALNRLDGGTFSLNLSPEIGPFASIVADDDEAIGACLVACGATVTDERRCVEGEVSFHYSASLSVYGVPLTVVSRSQRNHLRAALAETVDRVRAGESLPEIAARPLRLVGTAGGAK